MNTIRIIFWNSQGVARKRLELIQIIQEKDIDILLLNETHLGNNTQFQIPNFHTYKNNKPLVNGRPPAGGTAIVVHKRFNHYSMSISTNSINNTTIYIKNGNSELSLVAVYKSPNTSLQTTDLDIFLNTTNNVIIAGDLCSKHSSWNSRVNNKAGRTLFKYINS